ncbi:SDR family NAD(P)-dependent oxidoreductase [Williamsia sp. SKLECPSW1]
MHQLAASRERPSRHIGKCFSTEGFENMGFVVAPSVPTDASHDLTGKTAVVTGGTKGIGAGIVDRLVRGGAVVVAVGRSAPSDLGPNVHFVAADLSSLDGARALVDDATQLLGHIDVLVNNAGSTVPRPSVLDISDAQWVDDITINYLAAVRVTSAVLPDMYQRESGAVINVSSVATNNPVGPILHYASAKAALNTYTVGLATEAADHGVRVNAVSPGFVPTAASLSVVGPDGPPPASTFPLGRYGNPSDIAEVVAFLASNRSPWITGINVAVAGGTR